MKAETTAKHTPGVWRIGKQSVRNGVQIFSDSDWPLRSHVICTMPDSGKGKTANARLIAQAPILLAALKHIADLIGIPSDDESKAIESTATAAITLAEGR